MDIKATISAAPKELTDRQLVNTPIGPVCMSRTEYELYRAEPVSYTHLTLPTSELVETSVGAGPLKKKHAGDRREKQT